MILAVLFLFDKTKMSLFPYSGPHHFSTEEELIFVQTCINQTMVGKKTGLKIHSKVHKAFPFHSQMLSHVSWLLLDKPLGKRDFSPSKIPTM